LFYVGGGETLKDKKAAFGEEVAEATKGDADCIREEHT